MAFPDEAAAIDELLLRDGYEEAAYFTWIERFSQLTTDAIKRGDFEKAAGHMNLLSCVFASGDEATKRCIDVAYVESLMWDIKEEKLKREGWRLIPSNLRALYIAMWGERPFMSGAK